MGIETGGVVRGSEPVNHVPHRSKYYERMIISYLGTLLVLRQFRWRRCCAPYANMRSKYNDDGSKTPRKTAPEDFLKMFECQTQDLGIFKQTGEGGNAGYQARARPKGGANRKYHKLCSLLGQTKSAMQKRQDEVEIEGLVRRYVEVGQAQQGSARRTRR